MSNDGSTVPFSPVPRWRPIGRIERRVLGVLVEKAKTTPDAYPLTLNALTTGCNQKSNRDPLMNLQPDQVESALERLRHVSAVIEVSGGGRVSKYRHLLYEWLGVDKIEAAVMTELLLRGAQTVGELRGRAARMEPIADVAALQPVLQSLIQKKLVVSLTPQGRGQVVTHALFLPDEMEKVRRQANQAPAEDEAGQSDEPPPTGPAVRQPAVGMSSPVASLDGPSDASVAQLRADVDELKAEVVRLKREVQDLWSSLS